MLRPGSTVGFLGGGQLAQMLALRAASMGYKTAFLEPDPHAPAAQVSERVGFGFAEADLEALAARCDVITVEFENVPPEALAFLEARVPVRPAGELFRVSRHRALEKHALAALGLPTAPYRVLAPGDDVAGVLGAVGGRGILKTAELGYDGKGQRRVASEAELAAALAELNVPCVLEGYVDFVRELSIQVARNPSGELAFSGLVENLHAGGILRRSVYPAAASEETELAARQYARTLAEAWRLEGLLTLELFELEDGSLRVNEIAPRVHNSGHLTQDGGGASQFEMQLRAALDLPLADFAPQLPCVMVNILGWPEDQPEPAWEEIVRLPGARLHLYGKAHRPGRKLGHVNVVGKTRAEVLEGAARVEAVLGVRL
ncbi:5-(carboxyamino)imidazole ribonucleotide synthase [Deinobacterium chartae]|uniref:N5-carboxyaminoimidazole ribonucleotide synthase n=1 Tax=Deinobacterium chartae TaxID=521158 RepID=A0A841I562_9DEIO|nr:5-(carboxyamino)imidazole ribonucleotide synthase [Deinobacterium chartae]MBB6099419.1 5-(carboxyamino)imidazole ribonucleotide synthase [Deinobacterium chartae]